MNGRLCILIGALLAASQVSVTAQETGFRDAPAAERQRTNPQSGPTALQAGATLYATNCSGCHGARGEGTANVPGLANGLTQQAKDGELFWFIGRGDVNNGMPSWSHLPEAERWQIVTYLKALPSGNAPVAQPVAAVTSSLTAPPPVAPFTDFRYEAPGRSRRITVEDLPKPYATNSSGNPPKIVPRPADAWPKAPPGFKVELYAEGLTNPRIIHTAPNGDIFVAETEANRIRLFRGMTKDGKPESSQIFAADLNQPFGIAFYPAGADPQWIYVADTDAVLRFPYRTGDVKPRGAAEKLASLPWGRGHSTRDIQFAPDGKTMFVSVGSESNVSDPDTTPTEKNRADILQFNIDGSGEHVYAYGIRNAVGLAINPTTGELWCSVNERDGLGDNLVPDYITHVAPGGFYGWPWWYIGSHQDPRHEGKHPELKDKTIVPDVLLQPHNASLGITFYQGKQFPAEYQGDLFAAEHGSWNKSVRVGYELIRVPLHQSGHASGDYQDFLTGFVVDNNTVWGRPVGVTMAPDGSLLVTDDGSGSIWRVSYVGK
jgi:glucose/arabinose dehydrogenase